MLILCKRSLQFCPRRCVENRTATSQWSFSLRFTNASRSQSSLFQQTAKLTSFQRMLPSEPTRRLGRERSDCSGAPDIVQPPFENPGANRSSRLYSSATSAATRSEEKVARIRSWPAAAKRRRNTG